MKSKYILSEDKAGVISVVVFSDLVTHKQMVTALNSAIVFGAGFCHIEITMEGDLTYECYGESTSLNIKSNGADDAKFLNKYLGITPEF